MKKQLLFLAVSLLSAWQLNAQTTNGLSFDGTNDYITCGNILTASYTKEAWVLTNGAGLNNNFVSGGSAGQTALWAPSSYSYKLSGGHNGAWNQVQDAVALTLGTWYHIALSYDAATTTMKLYKNGVLVSTNAAVPAYTGGTTLQLGSYDGGGNLLNGSMDEVRIWNYARTGADIQANMNCELNGPQTGLIAYYQFDQGIAAGINTGLTTLTDISGNNNNATLINFALSGTTSNWVTGSPVNPLPNVTASATNPVICAGDFTTLNGGGASTYVWTGSVTDAVAFAPTISGTYTVTGTDVNGCTNTAVQSIVVNNLPVVTANVTNAVICAGDFTTLSGSGANTYVWTGSVTDAVAFAPTSTNSYTVTGTDGNGCMNTAIASVTVNNLPSVIANATSTSVCIGGLTTLSGSGASTYTWTGSVVDAVAFAPTTTDTYTVTGVDANGCVNTDVVSVAVNNLPTVTASVTNPVVCFGNTTTFNGGGASTYTWTGGVTNASPFSPTATASYTVTGTDLNGCTNTDITSVTVNSLPTVTASSSSSLICAGQTATLTANGALTYTWNTSATTTVIAITPSTTSSYTLTGSDANGCTNSVTISQAVSLCTGIPSVNNNSSLIIYPNPTNGLLTIQNSDNINLIEVMDVTGRIVISEKIQSLNQFVLNMSTFQNAIYIVRITDISGTITQTRVVVQK